MDLNKIKELYNHNINKHGCNPQSVGWGNQEKIDMRFKQLFQIIDPAYSFSLNEIGCGYGEAVKYCLRNNLKIEEYTGLEISEKMLAAAEDYLKDFKNKKLIIRSFLDEKKDYSIASGIFNVFFDAKQADWDNYILSILNNMAEFSEYGFSFNMLTKYVDFKAENLNYADPMYYFDYCKKNYSRNVSLIHDYDLYEFTITVKKNAVR